MDLTIKEVHAYYNLITEGKAPRLVLAGCEGGSLEELLVPNLDDDDRLFFLDLTTGTKVYPGKNTEDFIRETLDRA